MTGEINAQPIFIASDHAAFAAKEQLLAQSPWQLINLGPFTNTSCDYPDFALLVVKAVLSHPGSLGILLCGSGIGMSMAANRFADIRAAVCRSEEDARLAKEHNNANILCLGARVSSIAELIGMTNIWLHTTFASGRHAKRIEKYNWLGEKL